MPIEILGYFPKSMKNFITFCINGAPTPPLSTRPKPGVFNWLYGRGVPEVHFFTSAETDPVQVFVAAIKQPASEPGPMPWFGEIYGFEDFIINDGELRLDDAFSPLNQPYATLTRNIKLEKEFEKRRKPVDAIFAALRSENKSGLSFTVEQFEAALRGDRDTDLQSLLTETEEKLDAFRAAK